MFVNAAWTRTAMNARQAQMKKTFYEIYDGWMASCTTRVITGGRFASSKYSGQRSFLFSGKIVVDLIKKSVLSCRTFLAC
jgi:hypothetical protein